MISVPDRRQAVELIDEACHAGARQAMACAVLDLSVRTYQRWQEAPGDEEIRVDGRPTAMRPAPVHKLSVEERERILAVCNAPLHASLPPSQIVPRLADDGVYLASESTFYRVLREAHQQHARGRSQPPRVPRPLATHQATAPCQLWTWDISWLPGPIRGQFFYLYLILDVWSRKIVGWEVFEQESADHAASLIQRAVWAEGCLGTPLVLHADNGSPMKGSTMRSMLEALGVQPSYSRPRVSNDNPYSEALFRTCKYRPGYPTDGFASLDAARDWMLAFVRWYNHEHRHSAIRFVTPQQRHDGLQDDILKQRKAVYEQAKTACPQRWTGTTRTWDPIGEVWLNPDKKNENQKEIVAEAA
jgi:transposase InsO family protein